LPESFAVPKAASSLNRPLLKRWHDDRYAPLSINLKNFVT
jgi:hypothetical protein